jgi:hypothetical protein
MLDERYIIELSGKKIANLSDQELRGLIRGTKLPLQNLGRVAEKLEHLDRHTLVRLVYQIRRQYQEQCRTRGIKNA